MDRDFTDCTRNLVNDVLAIETKCQRKDYRGQNAEQYMNELERNLELCGHNPYMDRLFVIKSQHSAVFITRYDWKRTTALPHLINQTSQEFPSSKQM